MARRRSRCGDNLHQIANGCGSAPLTYFRKSLVGFLAGRFDELVHAAHHVGRVAVYLALMAEAVKAGIAQFAIFGSKWSCVSLQRIGEELTQVLSAQSAVGIFKEAFADIGVQTHSFEQLAVAIA